MSGNLEDVVMDGVVPSTGTAIIPAGDYLATCVEQEVKANKTGSSKYLSLTFQVLAGPSMNRKIFVNLNLWHEKKDVQGWAKSDKAAIEKAIGMTAPAKDSSEYLNRPLILAMGVRREKDSVTGKRDNPAMDFENHVKAFKSKDAKAGGTTAAAPAGFVPPTTPPAAFTPPPVDPGASPWKK